MTCHKIHVTEQFKRIMFQYTLTSKMLPMCLVFAELYKTSFERLYAFKAQTFCQN